MFLFTAWWSSPWISPAGGATVNFPCPNTRLHGPVVWSMGAFSYCLCSSARWKVCRLCISNSEAHGSLLRPALLLAHAALLEPRRRGGTRGLLAGEAGLGTVSR